MEFIKLKFEDIISPNAFFEQNVNWLFFISLGEQSKYCGGKSNNYHDDEYYWCERICIEFFLKNNMEVQDGITTFISNQKELFKEVLYKELNASKHRDFNLKIDSSIAFVMTKIKENQEKWDLLRSEYNQYELNKELDKKDNIRKKIVKC